MEGNLGKSGSIYELDKIDNPILFHAATNWNDPWKPLIGEPKHSDQEGVYRHFLIKFLENESIND